MSIETAAEWTIFVNGSSLYFKAAKPLRQETIINLRYAEGHDADQHTGIFMITDFRYHDHFKKEGLVSLKPAEGSGFSPTVYTLRPVI